MFSLLGRFKTTFILLAFILASIAAIAWIANGRHIHHLEVKATPQYQTCNAYLNSQVHPQAAKTAERACLDLSTDNHIYPDRLERLHNTFIGKDYGTFNRYLLNAGPPPNQEATP